MALYDTEQDSVGVVEPPASLRDEMTRTRAEVSPAMRQFAYSMPPGAPSEAVIPPGRRGNMYSQMQASDAEIGTAVGQLNAGQPVTALPQQSWSLAQAQAFNARLDAFDKQAAAARSAAEQAARDAALLDQMSRVAKTTKDIQVVRQQQDVIGFRNAVAGGMNPVHAMSLFPLAASSALVAAAKAEEKPAQPQWVGAAGGAPGHFVTRAGGVAFPPASYTQMPTPTIEQIGPNTTVTRTSPNRFQVLSKPRPEGDLTEAEQAELTDIRREESDIHREMTAAPRNFKVGSAPYTAATNRLATLKAAKDAIKKPSSAATTNAAPAFDYVRNSKTGRYEKAKKP